MEQGQGTGRDTRVMLPVFACVYMIAAELFLPWFSVPVLKYDGFTKTYSLWKIKDCLENIIACTSGGGRWQMEAFTGEETAEILKYAAFMKRAAVLMAVLLAAGAVFAYWKRKKSVIYMRFLFGVSVLFCLAGVWGFYKGNCLINAKMGRADTFVNLTADSYLQLTSYVYAQIFLSVFMIFAVKSLLDTEKEYSAVMYMERTVKEDKGLGKRTKLSILLILFGIPAVIAFGVLFLNDRSSVFIGMCIVILAMLPFAMVFEDRKPQARELLLIAVMAALEVVGRMAFFMLPQFKPVAALVIITGVSLGAEAGFLTGAVGSFVSNFFFGQGPWTPWQMFAFGIIGFLAGILFRGKSEETKANRILLSIYGGFAVFIIYGFVVDCSSAINFSSGFSLKNLWVVILSGLPFNFAHGVSTVIFLYILAKPMCRKLSRIKRKYGIMEQ